MHPIQIQKIGSENLHVFVRYEDNLYLINLKNGYKKCVKSGKVCEVYHNGLYLISDVSQNGDTKLLDLGTDGYDGVIT